MPFNHLGIPIGDNMNRIKAWDFLIERFKKKLSSWKAKALSFGGRLTLVKSVPGSLPIYLLSLFKAPKNVIKKLEGLRRNFLWGGNAEKKSISWVKWRDVMAPKEIGGLGVGSIRDTNIALLCKWRWNYKACPGSFWTSVIKAIHEQPRVSRQIPCNMAVAGAWKQIVSAESELVMVNLDLNKLIKVKVGRGDQTQFWYDWWLGGSL